MDLPKWLEPDTSYLMYPTVAVMGLSQSIALNTSINLIGEVVGLKGDQGAIVYGFYSFFDKLGNGLILYFIMVNDYWPFFL